MNRMLPQEACPAQTPGPESYGSTERDFSSRHRKTALPGTVLIAPREARRPQRIPKWISLRSS